MIYLLSDLHADWNFRGWQDYLSRATDDDLLIILGDVCLKLEPTEENADFTERFLSVKKRVAFIDGNHENFPYLYTFPEDEWCGGRVNRLSESIVMLRRGEIYNIEGKTFFTFGGCKSSDTWRELGLYYEGEEPTEEQLANAYSHLEACGGSVDYVLTHKYSKNPSVPTSPALDELVQYIDSRVEFSKWYAGHWHRMGASDEKHFFVYDELVALG